MSSLLGKKIVLLVDFFSVRLSKKDSFTFKIFVPSNIVNWFLNYCQEIDKS